MIGVFALIIPAKILMGKTTSVHASDLVQCHESIGLSSSCHIDSQLNGFMIFPGSEHRSLIELSINLPCQIPGDFDSGISLSENGFSHALKLPSSFQKTISTKGPIMIQVAHAPLLASMIFEGSCHLEIHATIHNPDPSILSQWQAELSSLTSDIEFYEAQKSIIHQLITIKEELLGFLPLINTVLDGTEIDQSVLKAVVSTITCEQLGDFDPYCNPVVKSLLSEELDQDQKMVVSALYQLLASLETDLACNDQICSFSALEVGEEVRMRLESFADLALELEILKEDIAQIEERLTRRRYEAELLKNKLDLYAN